MIKIEEIPVENINDFWSIHIRYLVEDGIISDKEGEEYFSGDKYRGIIKARMLRDIDKLHMVYFVQDNFRIGATQYITYQSEDGKCFILDFWVFPQYRGNGTGHNCFQALEKYTSGDGARYYELNCDRDHAIRFWKSLGFIENGVDEFDVKLFVRKEQ